MPRSLVFIFCALILAACLSQAKNTTQPTPSLKVSATVQAAPHTTPFGRMDEVKAARELVLCCWLPDDYLEKA